MKINYIDFCCNIKALRIGRLYRKCVCALPLPTQSLAARRAAFLIDFLPPLPFPPSRLSSKNTLKNLFHFAFGDFFMPCSTSFAACFRERGRSPGRFLRFDDLPGAPPGAGVVVYG